MNERNLQNVFGKARAEASASDVLTNAVMSRVGVQGQPTPKVLLVAVGLMFFRVLAMFAVCAVAGTILTEIAREIEAGMPPDFTLALQSVRPELAEIASDPDFCNVFHDAVSLHRLEILARAVLPVSLYLLAGWFLLSTAGITLHESVSNEKESVV